MVTACESLATKAELQELKAQINKLLGKTAAGGEIDVLAAEDLTGTIIGDKLDLAESAMQDIKLQTLSGSDIGIVDDLVLAALAQGQAQFVKLKGKNVIAPLKFVTDTTKKTTLTLVQNKEIGKIATTGAKVSSASIAVLSSLVNIIASLGLNIATVKILGNRIDLNEKALQDWNRDYTNLINLNSRVKQDLNQTSSELQKAQGAIEQQKIDLKDLQTNLTSANDDITTLNDSLNDAFSKIQTLEQENTKLYTELTNFSGEVTDQIQELTISTVGVQSYLEVAKSNFEQLFTTTENLAIELANLQGRTTVLEDVIFDLSLKNSVNIAEISLLKKEVAEGLELANSKLKNLEAQLILIKAKSQSGQASGGVFPVGAQKQVASTQTRILELMNQLAGNPFSQAELNIETYQLDSTNPFGSLFDNLLAQINLPSLDITDMQLQQLTDTLQNGIEAKLLDFGLDNVTSKLTDIQSQTAPQSVIQNLEDALCNSASPGKCLSTKVTEPIKTGQNVLKNAADILTDKIDIINTALNTKILTKVNATQNFLNTAWQSTTVQKGLTAMNTILLVHNASMLSRDLAGSVGDLSSMVLNGVGITDFEGNPIDVNNAVGSVFTSVAQTAIGAENYLALQKSLAASNRIIQAANGTISALQNMKNASLEGLEIVGSWTATIGNSLQEQGILESNSFPWMDQELDLKTPLGGLIGKFQVAQEIVDEITALASSGIEVIESANELINQSTEFKSASTELKENLAAVNLQKQQIEDQEKAASASPDVERLDLIKLEPEEIGV